MFSALSRRGLLSRSAALGGCTLSGWLSRLAAAADPPVNDRSCILLWMSGGPSHIDTFDLKPEAPANIRSEFQPIATSTPGIEISEHFPRFARLTEHAAVLRGMSTVETDHQLAAYHLHTGWQKRAGGIEFPSLGSIVSQELGDRNASLPNYVCIGGGSRLASRSGFLGPDHQPLDVTDPDRGAEFVQPLTSRPEFQRQFDLARNLDALFQQRYAAPAGRAHASALDRAVRLMNSPQQQAFDLSQEPAAIRDRYGRGSFGQGCLTARRLVEAGVRFVEVISGDGVGWDTHRDNFPRTRALSAEVDAGMAALMDDLEQRGRLDTTLVIWMGEFGRTPQLTSGGGRNHWARAWSTVLAGGGVRGGQVVGRTDRHAAEVLDRPVSVVDFLATVCTLLGIDHTRHNRPPGVDRPIPIVDSAGPVNLISELL